MLRIVPARRAAAALLMALVLVVGCGEKARNHPALAPGFGDAPLLAHVPADTAYVFASFEALPPEVWQDLLAIYGPPIQAMSAMAAKDAGPGNEAAARMAAAFDALPSFDRAGLEKIGIAPEGRFVLYGLGAYPVLRIELTDGERLRAAVARVSAGLGTKVPPPTQEGSITYWTFDQPDSPVAVIAAIAPRELVFAALPSAAFTRQRALVLGLERPARALDPQVLRDVAHRGGYAPYGVGFADVARIHALAVNATGAVLAPACKQTIDATTARAPRLTFGYGPFANATLAFAYRFELASDLARDVQALATKVVAIEPPVGRTPLFHVTAAADLDRARALATRASGAFTEIGSACAIALATEVGRGLAELAAAKMPSGWATLRGGSMSVYRIELGPDGEPSKVEGAGVITLGDTSQLVAVMKADPATRDAAADGKVRPLPAFPFSPRNYLGITRTTIAAGMGDGTDRIVTAGLAARPKPAPLVHIAYDMGGLLALLPQAFADEPPAMQELMRGLFAGFGGFSMELSADAHGVAVWNRVELRPQPPPRP